jgi:hypothetical protein
MMNLKPLMKEKVIGEEPNFKPGLLKKKPFGKPTTAPKPMPGLMKRLTGK